MTFGRQRQARGLSLRARVLAGLAVIALIAVAVAAAVTVTTHSYLMRQLDERLTSFAGPGQKENHSACNVFLPIQPGFSGQGTDGTTGDDDEELYGDRPSEAWRGLLCQDGTYQPIFAPTVYAGESLEFPNFYISALSTTVPTRLTITSSEGEHYRVVAVPLSDGWEITMLPLEPVESATERLIVIQAAGIGALVVGLGVVAWWVLRLGVTPMRRLVDASTRIADGDMAVRLDDVGGGKEVAELGHSLNTMVSRLTDALTERERSEARLREFVADASHELRTPLTTVLGYAQLFRKGALARKADQNDAWGRTEAEAARMKRLVDDMLELARYDAEPQLHQVHTSLHALVGEVLADAGRAFPGTAFEVAHVPLADGAPAPTVEGAVTADVDPDKIRQAVINVVTNAAQHGATRVTVSLSTRMDDAVQKGDEPAEFACIEVADNGPGMSAEVAARATERFVRGDSSRSRTTGGAGLGLAITAAIVQAHGGSLSIDSAPGAGTTVSIELPA